MYSLSTCWNSHRHTDGRAMLQEIRGLGFEFAELSHGIRMGLLPGVLEAVDAGDIRISSLHNFCPLPLGVIHPAPNLYQFTAEKRREWDSALKHSLRTIETAARVGAKLVVLHLGSVPMKDYTDDLVDMLGENKRESSKFRKLVDKVRVQRERLKGPALERAYELVDKLVTAAAPHGIQLGIENREALEEVPFEEDYDALLDRFPGDTVVYWHDCGHAQIKENLGFINHLEHLEARAARLRGFHIHDVQFPGRDHCPPGTGMIDFALLKQVVEPQHIKVFELQPGIPVEEVMRSVKYLKQLWGDT